MDALRVSRYHALLSTNHGITCDAPIGRADGNVGRLECRDDGAVRVATLTPVWAARFPAATCGGDRDRDTRCAVPAPAGGSDDCDAVMVDDYVYLTRVHMP